MKKVFFSVLWILLALAACEKNDADSKDVSIGNKDLDFTILTAYESSAGLLLSLAAEETQILILLSDAASDNYYIKDTLKADDFSRSFACVEYQGIDYIATGGVLNMTFEEDLISGSFDLQFGDNFDLKTESFNISNINQSPYESFSEISMVDENGAALSIPDFSDWKLKDEFGLLERVLFGYDEDLAVDSSKNQIYAAYPNPCKGVIALGFKTEAKPQIRFDIVNENFEILQSINVEDPLANGFNLINFNFEGLPGIAINQFYRMYYRIESDGGIVRGHGDIQYID